MDHALDGTGGALPAEMPLGVPVDMQTGRTVGERTTRTQKMGTTPNETSGAQVEPSMGRDSLNGPGQGVDPGVWQSSKRDSPLGALLNQRLASQPICTGRSYLRRQRPPKGTSSSLSL